MLSARREGGLVVALLLRGAGLRLLLVVLAVLQHRHQNVNVRLDRARNDRSLKQIALDHSAEAGRKRNADVVPAWSQRKPWWIQSDCQTQTRMSSSMTPSCKSR